jgi:hypothetical protein
LWLAARGRSCRPPRRYDHGPLCRWLSAYEKRASTKKLLMSRHLLAIALLAGGVPVKLRKHANTVVVYPPLLLGRQFLKCAMFIMLGFCIVPPAWPTADGPDHFQVKGVAPGKSLHLRAEPGPHARRIGRIPASANCLTNLGCEGGLRFAEYSALSAEARAQRLAANPRWCKVDFRGALGWVAGTYLREGACLPKSEGGQ